MYQTSTAEEKELASRRVDPNQERATAGRVDGPMQVEYLTDVDLRPTTGLLGVAHALKTCGRGARGQPSKV